MLLRYHGSTGTFTKHNRHKDVIHDTYYILNVVLAAYTVLYVICDTRSM